MTGSIINPDTKRRSDYQCPWVHLYNAPPWNSGIKQWNTVLYVAVQKIPHAHNITPNQITEHSDLLTQKGPAESKREESEGGIYFKFPTTLQDDVPSNVMQSIVIPELVTSGYPELWSNGGKKLFFKSR